MDEAGEELICNSREAAVSSSGVHAGEAGADRPLALAVDCRRIGGRIDLGEEDCDGRRGCVDMGWAGPGNDKAGSICVGCESGARNEPESGGVGNWLTEGGRLASVRQLGSMYGCGSHAEMGGRQGDWLG